MNRLRQIGEGEAARFFEQQAPPPPEHYGISESGQPPTNPPEHYARNQPNVPLSQDRIGNAVTSAVLLALRTLSQRTLIAIADLFTLVVGASAWWLWLTIMPSPSVYQLVGVGLYGLWALALVYLARRRR